MQTKKVPLFNPLSKTFSYDWFDDNNEKHTLVMDPIAITYFEPTQVNFMIKHLVDAWLNENSMNRLNHTKEIVEITKRIKLEI